MARPPRRPSVLGVFALALSVPLAYGPRPAREALATLDVVVADHPFPGALMMRALLLAMLDRMDEAWSVALPAEERLRELAFATGGAWLGEIALLAGDYEAAASYLRDACNAVEAIGNEASCRRMRRCSDVSSPSSAATTKPSCLPGAGASSAIRRTS